MAEPFAPRDSIPQPEDIECITQTSRDYIEGWYTADAERMRRSLHPELVKRTLMVDTESGIWLLRQLSTAEMMVEFTRQGGGSDVPETERSVEIVIQDVFRHIAAVKVVSRDMLDYLHLVKLNDQWFIVNVLWELRDGEIKASLEGMTEMVREYNDRLREAEEPLKSEMAIWDEKLNPIGDDAQLANVDLQNILQKSRSISQTRPNFPIG